MASAATQTKNDALDTLRKNAMMAHLLDSLNAGKDIGHYGRLVFAIVAHHFLDDAALTEQLAKDKDFSPEQARSLVAQVRERDYSPPRREKILEYQAKQDFPLIQNPDDPDDGNVYRDLEFPESLYEHISEYHEHHDSAAN